MVAMVETVNDKGLPDMPAYVGGAMMKKLYRQTKSKRPEGTCTAQSSSER